MAPKSWHISQFEGGKKNIRPPWDVLKLTSRGPPWYSFETPFRKSNLSEKRMLERGKGICQTDNKFLINFVDPVSGLSVLWPAPSKKKKKEDYAWRVALIHTTKVAHPSYETCSSISLCIGPSAVSFLLLPFFQREWQIVLVRKMNHSHADDSV